MEIIETGVGQPTLFYGHLTSPGEWDLDPDADWTTDERQAVEDGGSYTPPTDPPVDISDTPGGIEVASGFQSSSMDDDDEMLREHHDEDAPYDVHDAAIADNVARELNEDAATTHLNVHVASVRGTVFLTGYVRDPNDGDLAASVAERVPGVRFVVDRLVVGDRPRHCPAAPHYDGQGSRYWPNRNTRCCLEIDCCPQRALAGDRAREGDGADR
jgi:hypothetical protein